MLGLDAKALSVPDYEITTRLERILATVQPQIAVPFVPMIPGPTTNHRHRSPSPGAHRTRSISPLHIALEPQPY